MVLVFDVGGTSMRLALSDDLKTITQTVRLDTEPSAEGPEKLLAAIAKLKGEHELEAVVGGLPGSLDPTTGAFLHAYHLRAWEGFPIVPKLQEIVNCPVNIVHDVVLGGLGEAHFGAGITKGVMAYITVSTGVGVMRLVDGVPDPTIDDNEAGHQLNVSDDDLSDLETFTAGSSISARWNKPPKDIKDPKVWAKAALYLARGVYNTNLYWTPDVVVFGGSMMRDIDLDLVAADLDELPKVTSAKPKLVHAKLGDDNGLYGALAWYLIHRKG